MIKIFSKNKEGLLIPSTVTQFHFLGGEPHLRDISTDEIPYAVFIQGCTADDLIMLAMVSDWAKQVGDGIIALMPYLPGARADRGIPFGAKVFADIINSMDLKEIVCTDPHSPVMPSLLRRLTILNSAELIQNTILQNPEDWAGLISPDAGSRQRLKEIADLTGLPVIEASKHRDFETGRLSGFTCEPLPDPKGKYLVVDDICDNGGTFRGLAETINIPKEQLVLWTTHGVYGPKAAANLKGVGEIWTTNSHPGSRNPEVGANIVDILPHLIQKIRT